jgi:TRAP-type C4-dicarboxylate transport system substrate-binding protein
VQATLTEAAQETQAFVYETAAQLETDLLGVIEAAGVEVNEADKQAFIDASEPIYAEFATQVDGGEDMVRRVREAAN